MPSGVVERALQALEVAALRTPFTSWPKLATVPKLERRAEALACTFDAQHMVNTLWAYATMGREPGARLMMELEGRAGTFNAQGVANTLWAYGRCGGSPERG